MNAVEDVRAVLLLRVGTSKADILRALAAMEGVYRVERIQGPYDIVVHVAGRKHVEAIEKHPGVTTAEICWVSPPHEVAWDEHATPEKVRGIRRAASPGRPRSSRSGRDRIHDSIEGFQ